MSWEDGWDEVIYKLKPRCGQPRGEERVDALEYLARAIAHIPEPRLHTLRYMGRYSNVVEILVHGGFVQALWGESIF